jgi:hypothetical protein
MPEGLDIFGGKKPVSHEATYKIKPYHLKQYEKHFLI